MKIIKFKNLWYKLIFRFVHPKILVNKASFSGDGFFIDIRYWISRPDKINTKVSPYLMTAQNQKIELMYFTRFGVMKTKNRKHASTGILLFYNKNKVVSAGDRVTLYWDGLKSADIVLKE